MTTRLTLVSPAMTTALREARFSTDDAGFDAAAVAAAGPFPAGRAEVYASPSPRCVRTAEALGLDATPLPALAPCATGRWQGSTLDEVAAAEPESVAAWLADPAAAPHGGESLAALHERVGAWLRDLAPEGGRVVVVAEPDVVRAAVALAVGAPASAFWRIDVRPLTATELSGRNGRWNLLSGRSLSSD
ncbi:histidine phosphatase family protein [Streptomyces sp. NBC_00370]|uniref:histidine phosphatase family protein n=3 Tax=unclassified Streptomyces TaxID=2593676 RepID=UPI002E260C47